MAGKRPRERARDLRWAMTDVERCLWYYLRNRQMAGFKFRRQHVIGGYIADFASPEAGLVIEADGGQHQEQQTYDALRKRVLEEHGYRELRFWDNEVLQQTEAVLARIHAEVKDGAE